MASFLDNLAGKQQEKTDMIADIIRKKNEPTSEDYATSLAQRTQQIFGGGNKAMSPQQISGERAQSQLNDIQMLDQMATQGDKRAMAIIDQAVQVGGKNPEDVYAILQELGNDPEDITPSNVYMKSLEAAHRTGVLQKQAQMRKQAEEFDQTKSMLDLQKTQSEISKNVALANKANRLEGIDAAATKPLPPQAIKAVNETVEDLYTARNLENDLNGIKNQIEQGQLTFGPVSNLIAEGRNAAGLSSQQSRNFASFKNKLEEIRNASLRLNKGVQTEGDAQRIMNELINNVNDPQIVAQRLTELAAINKRAALLKEMQLNTIYKNYGRDGYDYTQIPEYQPSLYGDIEQNKPTTSQGFTIEEID